MSKAKVKVPLNTTPQEQSGENPNRLDFPVVGIGASAGGLEAMQNFFEHIPEVPGVAFIIVQHLSPDHQSFMGELLERYTRIPISFITDKEPVRCNHIYLLPPKYNVVLEGGAFHLQEIVGRGLNLPIDIFFRSLAEDQQSNAVAIILSGAGSDGTLGIRALKEFGGIAMVQDPRDAKFDGMPKSALATDVIDLMRPADELAKELVAFLDHPYFTHPHQAQPRLQENELLYNEVIALLKEVTHVDFTPYRSETILRRLEKRISINRLSRFADYVKFLRENPAEVTILFHEILIGVTCFFRDKEAFESLERNILPELFRDVPVHKEIRIWVASCSTGEEVYSIAILVKEYMLTNRILADVKIFATDIDEKSLKYASLGFYPQNIVTDIPKRFLAKYFSPHGNGYQVNPDLRRMIIFAAQNLVDDPPFFKLDLITCRNFLIYINTDAQQRVLSSFYVGLKPQGLLFLGSSESLGPVASGFETIDSKSKLYRKREGYTPEYVPKAPMPLHLASALQPPPYETHVSELSQDNRELLAILEHVDNTFMPPSMILNTNYEIIYTIRDASMYLQHVTGRMTTNLLKLLPRDSSLILSSMIRRAETSGETISAELSLNEHLVDIQCRRITPPDSDNTYYYVSFSETAPQTTSPAPVTDSDLTRCYRQRIEELEREVRQHKERLQVAIEQLETSNEELQASNEELVSSNEELQSSNEELQSVNEELYTVNIEHVRKLQEVSELNADYDNLLSNTQIGTLYLDKDLVIRKISTVASRITNILVNDMGRPIAHLALSSLYPQFKTDIEVVHSTQKQIEREIIVNDKTYMMRIVPYVVEHDKPQGIIISFVDLTECKMRAIAEVYASQSKIRTSTAQLEAAAEIASLAYFQINTRTRACTGSKLFHDLWPTQNGWCPHPDAWIVSEDIPAVKREFDALRAHEKENIVLTFRTKYFGELRYYRIAASIIRETTGDDMVNGVVQNITRMIQDQRKVQAQEEFWQQAIDTIPVLFYVKDADHDLRYLFANKYFLSYTHQSLTDLIGKTDEEITPSCGLYHSEDLQALESEEPLSFENEFIQPDGTTRYFHTIKRRRIDNLGRKYLMGIGLDVTDQSISSQDLQVANDCMSAFVELNKPDLALRRIMTTLCTRLSASYCFLMSFNYKHMTATCEFELCIHPEGPSLFARAPRAMSFTTSTTWHQTYMSNRILDIPDVAHDPEALHLLTQYCGYPDIPTNSLYSVCLREKGVIIGAVTFLYTTPRPAISSQRIAYLMSFAAYICKHIFQRQKK